MKNLRMIIIMLGCLLCGVAAQGQEMVVDGFRELPGYIVKNTDMSKRRVDANGHLPALVLVSIASEEAKFSGQIVGPVEKREGEYCVYMVGYQGGGAARNLTVIVPGYKPLHVEFAPYGYKQLNEDTAYRLSITLPQTGAAIVDKRIYTLNITISGSNNLGEIKVYRNRKSATGYDDLRSVNVSSKTTKVPISALLGDVITVETPRGFSKTIQFSNSSKTEYAVDVPSEKRKVRFHVVDEQGEPLIGTTMFHYPGRRGSVNDIDGYTVNVEYDDNDYFTFEFVGHETARISANEIAGRATVEVVMKEKKEQTTVFANVIEPRWSADVTAKQKKVLEKLIANMVNVEGGTFMMGATAEQGSKALDWEKPAHRVTLSDYYIGKYEVTQAEWEAVMGQKPTSDGDKWTKLRGLGSNYPAYNISWNDCDAFIRKLNELTGLKFKLPTEAEWEFAARGGNESRSYKYSGGENIDEVAWYDDNSDYKTHPVGKKLANELGLHDMSGNVYEWCSDWYEGYYYRSSPQTDPTGPTGPGSGPCRVLRGGSWDDLATRCRVAYRGYHPVADRYYYSGMRLAL